MNKIFKYAMVGIMGAVSALVTIYVLLIVALGWERNDFNNALRLLITYQTATHNYVQPVDKNVVTQAGLKAMMASLDDPYSTYLEPEAFEQLMEQTSGDFSGIGAVVGQSKNKDIIIVKTMENSPSAAAGLEPGDIILGVNDKPVTDLPLEDAINYIRGPVGTKVELKIKRGSEIKNFTITRATIHYETVHSKMMDNQLGYISIAMFNQNTQEDFSKALAKLKADGAKGLIIDLRNNPGGLLDSVVKIGGDLLPAGKIVSIIYRNGHRSTYEVEEPQPALPMVVLINHTSASAAEVLAGALQDREVATLVGEQSFGKGSVQVVVPLTAHDGVKVTVAKYYTPAMRSIHKIGLTPDVVVAPGPDDNQDVQLQTAEKILKEKIQKEGK